MMDNGDIEDSTNGSSSAEQESSSNNSSSEDNAGGEADAAANLKTEEAGNGVGALQQQIGEVDEGRGETTSVEQREIPTGTTKTADDATSYQKRWAELYQRLVAYKEKHGHCRVPNRYDEDPQLGYWVSTQRRQHRLMNTSGDDAPLSMERVKKLEAIGFEWSAVPSSHKSWEGRYAELRDFVAKNGHALVPMGYEENPRLATWVSTQRQEYKLLKQGRSSRLTEEKKKKLDAVGFIWEAQRGRRKTKVGSSRHDGDSMWQDGADDDRKPPAKGTEKAGPRSRRKEPPQPKKAPPRSDSEIEASAPPSEARPTAAPDFPSRNSELAAARLPSTGELPGQPSVAGIADASTLERVRSLLSRPPAPRPSAPSLTSAITHSLNEGGRVQPNVTARLSTTPAMETAGLLRRSFTLNQVGGSQANSTVLRNAAVSPSSADPSLTRRPSLLREQDLLLQWTSNTANRGQGIGLSRPPSEESALQALLLRRSNLPAVSHGANLANLYVTQSRNRADQQLFQHTLLHQLAQQQQQQQEQLRQRQQLEALRSLQGLSLPSSASQLSQALALNSSQLLQSTNPARANPLFHTSQQQQQQQQQQEHLSLQNLMQQPHLSMEEIQQAQLRAAQQMDSLGALARLPSTTAVSLEEKTSDREDVSSSSRRKRPSDQSGVEPKNRRRS